MYTPNQIVECNGVYGRVMYYDPITHNVHVLFRISNNTWKIEKCDSFFCKPAQVFLWSTETAFSTKYMGKMRTPQFVPMEVNDAIHDYVMEI